MHKYVLVLVLWLVLTAVFGVAGYILSRPASSKTLRDRDEAWRHASTEISSNIHWLVTDHLGTPRMIIDQTGTLANVKRHDYLPFGEELFAGTGGRSTRLAL